MTEQTAPLTDLFDRHARLVIDTMTYQTNPILRDAADRIFALASLTAADVRKDGLEVFRTHAIITAFDRTEDGKKIVNLADTEGGGEVARRMIVVDLVTGETR